MCSLSSAVACSNRALHCKLSAWLQAFYRFRRDDCNGSAAGAAEDSTPLPPLIMLPGIGLTVNAFGLPLLAALSCGREVIALENRGGGGYSVAPGVGLLWDAAAGSAVLRAGGIALENRGGGRYSVNTWKAGCCWTLHGPVRARGPLAAPDALPVVCQSALFPGEECCFEWRRGACRRARKCRKLD